MIKPFKQHMEEAIGAPWRLADLQLVPHKPAKKKPYKSAVGNYQIDSDGKSTRVKSKRSKKTG